MSVDGPMIERTKEHLSAEESLVQHLVAICERAAEREEWLGDA